MAEAKYKTYFVSTTKTGGVYVYTDLNYELRRDNLFINPETNTLIIDYFFRGKSDFTRCLYDVDFKDITIEKVKE
jgi:hypothetical protein